MNTASLFGIIIFVTGVPAVTFVLLFFPRWRRTCIALMVFSTCHIKKPFYQEVFYTFYRGVDRGYGVTIPDLFFFGFALYLLIMRPGKTKWIPYALPAWWLVIGISIISLGNAGVVSYGLFTIHKFIRAAVLFWVMVNIVKDRRDIQAVLAGFTAALAWQGTVVLWNKYVNASVVNRVVGSFNHPNALTMYLDLILPIVWACFLEKVLDKRTARWALPALGLGFVSVIFTKSRAGIVLMPLTLAGTTCLSIILKPTAHKVRLTLVAALAGAIVASAALPMIIRRFEKAPKASAETRHYFNDAAKAMARDHRFGCGINQYSWSLDNLDYYWCMYPEALNLRDPEAFRYSEGGRSRLGTAHHIYYLFMGETGRPGMIAYILFLALIYLKALRTLIRAQDPLTRAVTCGMIFSFTLVYVHGLLEWVWRQTQTIYMYFILAGLLVAISERAAKQRTARGRVHALLEWAGGQLQAAFTYFILEGLLAAAVDRRARLRGACGYAPARQPGDMP